MGVMDKFISSIKFSDEDDYDDYDDDDYEDDDDIIELPKKKAAPKASLEEEKPKPVKAAPRFNTTKTTKKAGGESMEVCVIKPTSVDDTMEITDTLLEGRPVVLNVEGLDMDIAQRIIDITSGAAYAMRGTLQKISNCIFIVTPSSVDVSGDLQQMLSLSGSFNS